MWFGVWVGLAFATKENAFVTAALVGGVLGLVLIHSGLRQMVPRTLRWIADHRWHLLTAVAAAVLVIPASFAIFSINVALFTSSPPFALMSSLTKTMHRD